MLPGKHNKPFNNGDVASDVQHHNFTTVYAINVNLLIDAIGIITSLLLNNAY